MRCNNCGSDLAPGTTFCPNCGTNVTQEQVNLNKQQNQTQSQSQFGWQGGQDQSGFGQQGQGQPQSGFGQQTGPTQFGSQQFNGQGYGPNNPRALTNSPNFTVNLIIGILYTVCCCNFVFGLLGLVFTFMANTAWKNGDDVGYNTYSKVVTIVYVLGIVLYIAGLIIGLMLGIYDTLFFVFN